MPSSPDRVAFIGAGARPNKLMEELGWPPIAIYTKYTFLIRDDLDLDRLKGLDPDHVRYIPFDPTPLMWETIWGRGLRPTSIEATREWLKSLKLT
jgi:hypothetical protein